MRYLYYGHSFLVQLFEQARDYPNAVLWAQRMIENEPFEEKNYRHAMTLYALNNDRAAAISVYHRCVEFLRQELDVEPAKETLPCLLRDQVSSTNVRRHHGN